MKCDLKPIFQSRTLAVSLAILTAVIVYDTVRLHHTAEASPTATVSDWLTEPAVFNDEPVTVPCEPIILLSTASVPACTTKTTLRSGFTGGSYAFKRPGSQAPASVLTLDVELISEVKAFNNDTYEYTWSARNLGTGALTGVICGPNASLFGITQPSPLLGSAGLDRIVGSIDDLTEFQTYSTAVTSSSIQSKTVFCRLAANPTTERLAKILAPLENSPSRKEQCKDDGWQDFGFGNQGECVSYVETGNDSRGS